MGEKNEFTKSGIVSMEVDGDLGILTINNGRYNTLSHPNFMDIDVLDQWIHANDIKGLIITGKGRHFSAGADLEYLQNSKEDLDILRQELSKGKKLLSYIEELPIITVAAISGACFGGGLEIALSCKFKVASRNAMFAFPEATLGILPGLAGTVRLPYKIGVSKALELILTGKQITAEEAHRIKLVDYVCENKEHINFSKKIITELIQDKSMEQLNSIVSILNKHSKFSAEEIMKDEESAFINLIKGGN